MADEKKREQTEQEGYPQGSKDKGKGSGRKRVVKRTVLVALNICAIVCFWYLVRYCFIPMRIYHEAERLVSEQEYEQAEELFQSLSEQYDLTSESLNGRFSRIGGFQDAADQVYRTRYAEAEYLREQGQSADAGSGQDDAVTLLEQAIQIFTDLGGYSDSEDQAKNTELVLASSLADDKEYVQAMKILEELGGYDGGDFGNARELLDRIRYTLAGELVQIGKLDDAEKLYDSTEAYQDSYEKLRDLRYNMGRDALLISDFSSAKVLLQQVGDYKDAKDILAILDSAVDKVYQTDFTDIRGASTPAVTSYIWMHSVIVPGKLDEGISVKMQEDLVTGGVVTAGLFGSGSYDYNLEQVRDADTWYFNYYGSDTEDSGGPIVLQADFGENYASMTTRKVYIASRDAEEAAEAKAQAASASEDDDGTAKVAEAEDDVSGETSDQAEEGDEEESQDADALSGDDSIPSEQETVRSGVEDDDNKGEENADPDNDGTASSDDQTDAEEESKQTLQEPEFVHERVWSEVTDSTLAEKIREGFRIRREIQLAENGNQYFYNSTDDTRLPHYCSAEYCLNTGKYMAEDMEGRRYYCEDHYGEYTSDPAYSADTDPSYDRSSTEDS